MVNLHRKSFFFLMGMMLTSGLFAAKIESYAPNPGDVRVVPVAPTPEPDHVELSLMFPANNELKTSTPVQTQFRLEGYPIGTVTQVPRRKEIYDDPEGQAIHVIIDNHTYFEINEAFIDALDDIDDYYQQLIQKNIPFSLEEGIHLLRAFPVRSFNECLKGDKCFVAKTFYYKSKKSNRVFDLSAPFLTYNEPMGEYPANSREPLLFDFYIHNCQLSKDGYKIRLTIDGSERIITDWVPHYIYGLGQGSHTFRVQLLSPNNQPLPGILNDHRETVVLK